MNAGGIRFVGADDADAIRDIYAPYILQTAYTYECEVPTREDFSKRIAGIAAAYPYLVYESGGAVTAYAYASSYAERIVYRYSVATSIYAARGQNGKGIGRRLYTVLLDMLAAQGYHNAIAVIATPNPVSERMHETLGFARLGTWDNAGYKFNRWHGVAWYRKVLKDFALPPIPIRDYRKAGAEIGVF